MSATEGCVTKELKGLTLFEKYPSVWVILCIIAGILRVMLTVRLQAFTARTDNGRLIPEPREVAILPLSGN